MVMALMYQVPPREGCNKSNILIYCFISIYYILQSKNIQRNEIVIVLKKETSKDGDIRPVNSKLDWNDILAAIFEAK